MEGRRERNGGNLSMFGHYRYRVVKNKEFVYVLHARFKVFFSIILLFYYFIILLFYYFIILLLYYLLFIIYYLLFITYYLLLKIVVVNRIYLHGVVNARRIIDIYFHYFNTQSCNLCAVAVHCSNNANTPNRTVSSLFPSPFLSSILVQESLNNLRSNCTRCSSDQYCWFQD
jgi:hypothetical protein